MARMNLSIPDELKERMDKYSSVNWSQTASESFSNKLNEIESSIEVKNMTDAIARLKASRQNFKKSMEKEGYEDGLKWAMEAADYQELFNLSDYIKREGSSHLYGPIDTLQDLKLAITRDNYDFDYFDIDEMPEADCEQYISGFIQAALEVYDKVQE